jgi:hypothetical protein
MGQKETAVTAKNHIMIYGPKSDGTYIVEFRIANGEALAISVPVERHACSNTSRNECRMGYSCRTFHEDPCQVRVSQCV